MTTTDELLTRDRWQEQAPSLAGSVLFAVLVLALSATRLLPALLERIGTAPPAWLDGLELLGGGFSTIWGVLIVGGISMGWSPLRRLLGASLRLRVDGRLYLLALLVPVVIIAVAAALAVLTSGTRPAMATGTRPPSMGDDLLTVATVLLLLAPIFALSENLGWRAWLQRGLQVRVSPLVAALVVGVVWSLWHVPLWETSSFYAQLPFTGFLLATITRAVLLAALFNAANGSVVPVAVAHWAFNVATQLALPADPGESAPVFLAIAAVTAVVAAALTRWSRARATEQHPALL